MKKKRNIYLKPEMEVIKLKKCPTLLEASAGFGQEYLNEEELL